MGKLTQQILLQHVSVHSRVPLIQTEGAHVNTFLHQLPIHSRVYLLIQWERSHVGKCPCAKSNPVIGYAQVR